jgi:hypothetical protein
MIPGREVVEGCESEQGPGFADGGLSVFPAVLSSVSLRCVPKRPKQGTHHRFTEDRRIQYLKSVYSAIKPFVLFPNHRYLVLTLRARISWCL